ncbi:MAG: hydroxylase [Planctomycetota bacterium]
MQIQYLEIVTDEVDKLCQQYAMMHSATFGEPDPNLGNARTAKLDGGGMIAIRGPLREGEAPVIRPYVLVDDIETVVAAAKDCGAEIALERMDIPGHGTIAIVIQGGIECGLWQLQQS